VTLPYVVDHTKRVVFVTVSGRVSGTDIADSIRAIYEDSNWQPGFGIVWDGSGVTELLFERGDVAGLIEVQRSFRERAGSGRDVIITHRPLDEAVAKTYILLAKDIRPTTLAKSRWEALTALGGRV